jgi:hypothetical protein
VLLLNECLLLLLFISLSTQSGNFWIHPRNFKENIQNTVILMVIIYLFGVHPASYPMGNRGSFPGGKAAEA